MLYRNGKSYETALEMVAGYSHEILQTSRLTEKRAGQLRYELNKDLPKGEKPVGLVDCVLMAVAEENGLGIVSTDAHFKNYSGKTHLL